MQKNNFPAELEGISYPKIIFDEARMIIHNRPFIAYMWVPGMNLLGATAMIIRNQVNNEYFLILCGLFFISLAYMFSMNKVVINFKQKKVYIRNYNPLLNLWRRMMQMPFELTFGEVDKIITDYTYRKGDGEYYVAFITEAPYKFRIAIFKTEDQSRLFAGYLKRMMR